MLVMLVALFKALQAEQQRRSMLHESSPSSDYLSWQARLTALKRPTTKRQLDKFFEQTLLPILRQVCETMDQQGWDVSLQQSDSQDSVELRVEFNDSIQPPFIYGVTKRSADEPSEMVYFAEVYLNSGPQAIDLYAWTKTAIADDVIKHFEAYLAFQQQTNLNLPWHS
jgi:choline/glycine/proline betaine transport protein